MQWAGQLSIRVEFWLSGCTTHLLILAGYTSRQRSGCVTGQVNIVRLHIGTPQPAAACRGLVNRMPGYATGYPVVLWESGYITGQVDHPRGTYTCMPVMLMNIIFLYMVVYWTVYIIKKNNMICILHM